MEEKAKTARLIVHGSNPSNGGTFEKWDVGGGAGLYVDFCPYPYDTMQPETMAFPYDVEKDKIVSWTELRMWDHDATGGEAMRDLGYEPVE